MVEALGEVVLWDGSPGTELTGTVVARGNYMHSYGAQIQAFEATVLDGAEYPVPPEYALGELGAAQALYRSAESAGGNPSGSPRPSRSGAKAAATRRTIAHRNGQKSLRTGSVVPSQSAPDWRTWSMRPRVVSLSSMTSRQVAATAGASQ